MLFPMSMKRLGKLNYLKYTLQIKKQKQNKIVTDK